MSGIKAKEKKKSYDTRSGESVIQVEKKELLQWSKLFVSTTWTRRNVPVLREEDVTDNRAPAQWHSPPDLDLTRAIDDMLTGKDPSEWLHMKLKELGMTDQTVTDTVRVFRDSQKSTPNWMRARTVYNTFLARYRGLYGYYQAK